jgi:hypothetical protein
MLLARRLNDGPQIASPKATVTVTEFLSNLRLAVMRSEELVVEVGECSGSQKRKSTRRWKTIPSNGNWRLRILYVCCSYSDAQLSKSFVVVY